MRKGEGKGIQVEGRKEERKEGRKEERKKGRKRENVQNNVR